MAKKLMPQGAKKWLMLAPLPLAAVLGWGVGSLLDPAMDALGNGFAAWALFLTVIVLEVLAIMRATRWWLLRVQRYFDRALDADVYQAVGDGYMNMVRDTETYDEPSRATFALAGQHYLERADKVRGSVSLWR